MISDSVVSISLEKLVPGSRYESVNAPISGGTDTTPQVPFHKL